MTSRPTLTLYVAVLRRMEQEDVVHKGTKVFIFREEDQFDSAVQPECAVMGELDVPTPPHTG